MILPYKVISAKFSIMLYYNVISYMIDIIT